MSQSEISGTGRFLHGPGVAGWLGLAAACVVAGIFIGVTGEHNRMLAFVARSSSSVYPAAETPADRSRTSYTVYPVSTEELSQAVEIINESKVWDFSLSKTGKRMPYKVIQPPHVSHAMIVTDMPPAKSGHGVSGLARPQGQDAQGRYRHARPRRANDHPHARAER